MKWVYHASRVLLGGWWLFSGLMHFLWPQLQPLGDEPASIAFTKALMASGLFTWVKVIEVTLGLTMLANLAMPLTVIALVPLNVVIVYWNVVLDSGAVEWTFAALSVVFKRRTGVAVATLFLAACGVERPAGLHARTRTLDAKTPAATGPRALR